MLCIKKIKIVDFIAIPLVLACFNSVANNVEPTNSEINALKGTHSQFQNIELNGDSSYHKSKGYLDSLSLAPDVKYPSSVYFSREDAKMFNEQNKIIKELSQADAPKWINGNMESWETVATDIAEQSKSGVKRRIDMLYPDAKRLGKETQVVPGNNGKGLLKPDESLYYFISTSLPETSIKQILVSTQRSGGTAVIRGMLPNSETISDTMRYLAKLIKEAKLNPHPRIILDPRLFNAYSIDSAPAMVYSRGDVDVIAKGASTPEWIIDKGREASEYTDLGVISDVYDIVEKDLFLLIQEKIAKTDWEAKKKNTIHNFFKKQTFPTLSIAEKDSDYQLDPRIVFTKNIYSGSGQLLARKGDLVNPLNNFEGHNLSIYFIDPRDPRQKSLIKENLWKDAVGRPILIVNHLDADKGFKGIGELQKEVDHKIYMMGSQYIERFQLTHIPARVDIIGGKGMWMHEYGVDTVENAHQSQLNKGNN
ncbi:hypothetical protein EIJ81_00790 (plasmid) [Aliivibrio salmonicida]|uniref:TrbC family F-type conjugative pilus assembly protein n=1 Tax=Aliivibrio salmonicida TaxID=40269 RepID=UPI000F6D1040|nr:TrbC family F-type conjugative pilus assembly protein [Aliivibrio salmonicida]AZL83436.1 hypothetical protein EIJ81_00790 [Aliivibrio salmonicida]